MPAYYNEHDPKAAAWLRELIAAGLIAPGDVDTRSIVEVSPHDLAGYTQCHFFAGIGGWSLALRLAGWPDDRPVWTGSCPCQPFSAAGKGLGEKDVRHLWPVYYDLLAFGEPAIAFGEQVASAAGRQWLAGVRTDLEGLGYAVGAADLCAAGVGAPHIRQRLYWVAHANRDLRRPRRGCGTSDAGQSSKQPTGCGDAGRLANPDRGAGPEHVGEPGRRRAAPADAAERGGIAGGLAHADGNGRRQAGRDAASGAETHRAGSGDRIGDGGSHGFWGAYDILPCTDGKARRVGPGTFPLAHGVSGRVGLLRGYGNAIVPQCAAEFIRAADDVLEN